MDADSLIEELGYRGAPGFLDADRWHEATGHAHVFRHTDAACRGPKINGRFRGVYSLGISRSGQRRASTPVVYVCEAPNEAAAEEIHRLTWNQSAAPFVIVHTPSGVRLYTSFDYEEGSAETAPPSQHGVLEACIAFSDVAEKLDALRANHIDDGTLWVTWGARIDPSRRVDARLVENLAALGDWLHNDSGLERPIAHALIGRFVYLRYLRDRGVLTDTRLRGWNLDPDEVFGREIRLKSFHALLDRMDEWLNGSIFPLVRSGDRAPKATHVQTVAGVMLGDEVDTGQRHLSFRAYDFSHIPVELLSSIYEQFLAMEGRDQEAGAYYTPIPLVNFVLGELEDMHPLQRGMRVFDPACGSGAFLVQCYQILIEKCRHQNGGDLSPRELRDLLTEHIFGLDCDEDACRVTELSLALALLDQIPTEVLSRAHNFKLPSLHNKNIFQGDFFGATEPWREVAPDFAWIVGNPPWVKADAGVMAHNLALQWIAAHKKDAPVCGNQLAQAFAWKASTHLSTERPGAVAFVMPATIFFEKQRAFRAEFLSKMAVKAVANLANLRRVLFRGRCEQPAAVIFYCPRTSPPDDVYVYSPMVVNQEANRPPCEGQQQTVWTITIDRSEVRSLRYDGLTMGDPLPWKVSMWGNTRDLRLLRSLERRFPTFQKFAAERLHIAQGLELRDAVAEKKKPQEKQERLDKIKEVTGKRELIIAQLRDAQHVHSFPERALTTVAAARSYVREGRGKVPLEICRGPHVILSAARTFAVYRDDFIVVPPRQIGISGKSQDADLLRVLALYLCSSFVRYHQFFLSPQEGIRGGRSTQDALLQVPIPFVGADSTALRPWVQLHRELVEHSNQRWSLLDATRALVSETAVEDINQKMTDLEHNVDTLTTQALGLQPQEEWLIDDLIRVRLGLIDGKVGEGAAGRPSRGRLSEYAIALRDSLDAYLDRGQLFRHVITIVHEHRSGVVQIDFQPSTAPHPPTIEAAHTVVGRAMGATRLRIERSHKQWLYFNRNLVVYSDSKVFLFKPMQQVWWTRSQALTDADQIIADLVSVGKAA